MCNRFLNEQRVFTEFLSILVILMYRFMNRAENKSILFSDLDSLALLLHTMHSMHGHFPRFPQGAYLNPVLCRKPLSLIRRAFKMARGEDDFFSLQRTSSPDYCKWISIAVEKGIKTFQVTSINFRVSIVLSSSSKANKAG